MALALFLFARVRPPDVVIADKAFDSNAIIADLDERGAKVVISRQLAPHVAAND